MLERISQLLRVNQLRKQMRMPDFASAYAASATDADWRVLAPLATDAQLVKLRALQKALSTELRFKDLVSALERCCPPENDRSVVYGDFNTRAFGHLGGMFSAEMGMLYPMGKHSVNIMLTVLYEQAAVNASWGTYVSETFDPGTYDEIRRDYAALDEAKPAWVYAWIEQE